LKLKKGQFENLIMLKTLNKNINQIILLPTPSNIRYFWNFGVLLGVFLGVQILTGVILSLHYSNNTLLSFSRVIHITRDVNEGWNYRLIHSNGASFFLFFYIFTYFGELILSLGSLKELEM